MVVQPTTNIAKKANSGDKGKGCFIPKNEDTENVNPTTIHSNNGAVKMATSSFEQNSTNQAAPAVNSGIPTNPGAPSQANAELARALTGPQSKRKGKRTGTSSKGGAGDVVKLSAEETQFRAHFLTSILNNFDKLHEALSPQEKEFRTFLSEALKKDGGKPNSQAAKKILQEIQDKFKGLKIVEDPRNQMIQDLMKTLKMDDAEFIKETQGKSLAKNALAKIADLNGFSRVDDKSSSENALLVLQLILKKIKELRDIDDPRNNNIKELLEEAEVDKAEKKASFIKSNSGQKSLAHELLSKVKRFHSMLLERELDEMLKKAFEDWDHSNSTETMKDNEIMKLYTTLQGRGPYHLVRGIGLHSFKALAGRHQLALELFEDYFTSKTRMDEGSANIKFLGIIRKESEAKVEAQRMGIPTKTAGIQTSIIETNDRIQKLAATIQEMAKEMSTAGNDLKEVKEALNYSNEAKRIAGESANHTEEAKQRYEAAREAALNNDYLGAVAAAKRVEELQKLVNGLEQDIEGVFAAMPEGNKRSEKGMIPLIQKSAESSMSEIDAIKAKMDALKELLKGKEAVRTQAGQLDKLMSSNKVADLVNDAHEHYDGIDGEASLKQNVEAILANQQSIALIKPRIDALNLDKEKTEDLGSKMAKILEAHKKIRQLKGDVDEIEKSAIPLLGSNLERDRAEAERLARQNAAKEKSSKSGAEHKKSAGEKQANSNENSSKGGPKVLFSIAGKSAGNSASTSNSSSNDAQAKALAAARLRDMQKAQQNLMQARMASRSNATSRR